MARSDVNRKHRKPSKVNTMSRDFKIVDVFSSTPLKGNPVAVVLDADGLNTTQMQAIAGWINLSETTFLLPPTQPGATYKLRIFSLRNELNFAGHPTLGSAFAALEAKRIFPTEEKIIQECGVDLVTLHVEDTHLSLTLPEPKLKAVTEETISEIEATRAFCVQNRVSRDCKYRDCLDCSLYPGCERRFDYQAKFGTPDRPLS